MPYVNGLLAKQEEEDEREKLLAQLGGQQQPPVEQPEQRDGKDMVNAAVENAIRPAPNPLEIASQNNVIAQKQAYADAKDDAGRQMAASMADALRNTATAAGIDMSGYGSDVSLQDAQRNLASRQAQDIMEALQGQYAQSSDRYFEKEYTRALAKGYSDEDAKDIAGQKARRYQADRVAYLRGAYNSYGHDGRVTNNYGNMFLEMMASENPTLANFYAQVYPNQRDAYSQENQIARDMLQNNNLLERLEKLQGYEEKNMGLRFNYNEKSADNASERRKNEKFFDANVDFQDAKARAEFARKFKEQDPSKIAEWYKEGKEFAAIQGLSGEDLENSARQYVFLHVMKDTYTGKASGNGNKSQDPKLTAEQQAQYNTLENLARRAHETHSDADIAAFEDALNGEDGKGLTLAPAMYDRFQDMLLAMKGYQHKLKNDDNGAHEYWKRIKDYDVPERMYNENFDAYRRK